MMTNILIPVDGSETSLHAVREGVSFAKAFDSKVTLLYVLSQKIEGEPVLTGTIWAESPTARTEKDGYEMLEKCRELFGDHADNVDTVVILGTPTIGLEEYINEHDDIDFLIMGSQGLGSSLQRFLIGSTTKKILTHCKIPTLVVR